MICKERTDLNKLVVITMDDAPIMVHLLRATTLDAYLPSYPVDDGTFGVYPEMYGEHMWENLEEQGMTASLSGVVTGIVPLMAAGEEEGSSGEVKFFYQMLLSDGTLCLVRSFAIVGTDVVLSADKDAGYNRSLRLISIPGWSIWAKEKTASYLADK